jgi:hypothetical protein
VKPQSAHMQDFNTDLPLATFLYTLWFYKSFSECDTNFKKTYIKALF